jgi:SlyX protein
MTRSGFGLLVETEMSKPGNSVDRLEELESRLAFQDDLLGQLNDVVARQDKLIAELQLRLSNLERRIENLAESGAAGSAGSGHEVPPHY